MRIAFTTLGCKINQYDTDRMRRELVSSGGTIVPFDAPADIYIINTCSVTAKTDYQCRQAIRSAVRSAQGAKVVVTGCYAQTRPEELRNIPGVDLVIGNTEKERIMEHVRSCFPGTEDGETGRPRPEERAGTIPGGRTRGFLKIQDGCDSRCSYCIVPSARGRSRSVPEPRVLHLFEELVVHGCPEIVLSGVHIGMYGKDLIPATSLNNLLPVLLKRRGPARIRLSSIEPRELSAEIMDLLGQGVCRHLHVPLQSGDDAVLRAMNREYSSGTYRDILSRIAERVPGIALGADVMVGFPGEGDAEFRNTRKLIEDLPLSHLHVFSFSPRPGTPAAEMREQVPEPLKKERSRTLRELGERKLFSFRKGFLHKKLSVVIEEKHDATNGYLTGLSDNYIRVAVSDACPDDIGKELPVMITDVNKDSTCGVLARE